MSKKRQLDQLYKSGDSVLNRIEKRGFSVLRKFIAFVFGAGYNIILFIGRLYYWLIRFFFKIFVPASVLVFGSVYLSSLSLWLFCAIIVGMLAVAYIIYQEFFSNNHQVHEDVDTQTGVDGVENPRPRWVVWLSDLILPENLNDLSSTNLIVCIIALIATHVIAVWNFFFTGSDGVLASKTFRALATTHHFFIDTLLLGSINIILGFFNVEPFVTHKTKILNTYADQAANNNLPFATLSLVVILLLVSVYFTISYRKQGSNWWIGGVICTWLFSVYLVADII